MNSKTVYIENGEVLTSSILLAERLGVRHADILRKIDHKKKTIPYAFDDLYQEDFYLSKDGGKKTRCYLITYDGFALMAWNKNHLDTAYEIQFEFMHLSKLRKSHPPTTFQVYFQKIRNYFNS